MTPPAAYKSASAVQCSHLVDPPSTTFEYRIKNAARAGLDVRRCLSNSTYAVDGHEYCALHAGMVVLGWATRATASLTWADTIRSLRAMRSDDDIEAGLGIGRSTLIEWAEGRMLPHPSVQRGLRQTIADWETAA